MSQAISKLKENAFTSFFKELYHSFTPASRAAILFTVPFTVVDAIHYYTAGTALLISFPLLALIYLLCGVLAGKFATQEGEELGSLAKAGRSAAVRLWLTSTVINTVISLILGFTSFGLTLLGGIFYLCLFAPFHALGSALMGWLGGWLYQQINQRTSAH